MKFTQPGDNISTNGRTIGEAIEVLVGLAAGEGTVDGHTAVLKRLNELTRVVAAIAQAAPPWEQKQIGEALGLVHHNG